MDSIIANLDGEIQELRVKLADKYRHIESLLCQKKELEDQMEKLQRVFKTAIDNFKIAYEHSVSEEETAEKKFKIFLASKQKLWYESIDRTWKKQLRHSMMPWMP